MEGRESRLSELAHGFFRHPMGSISTEEEGEDIRFAHGPATLVLHEISLGNGRCTVPLPSAPG